MTTARTGRRSLLLLLFCLLLLSAPAALVGQTLFPAIERNDTAILRRLLERDRTPLRDTTVGGNTPLHYAVARSKEPGIVAMLMEYGADPAIRNAQGDPALHTAFNLDDGTGGSDSTFMTDMRILLDHGADPDVRDDRGRTVLLEATRRHRPDVIELLLAHHANVNAICTGWTPLDVAIARNDSTLIVLLKRHGGIETGSAALFNAIERNDTATVGALLGESPSLARTPDVVGVAPLHRAMLLPDTNVAHLLLKLGAGTDARDGRRRTPLHWAAAVGNVAAVAMLLNTGADVDPRDQYGMTPLAIGPTDLKSDIAIASTSRTESRASRNGVDTARTIAIARLLASHGADLDAIDFHDDTPLHHAAFTGSVEKARILLELGAGPSTRDNDERTPLHFAVGAPKLTADHIAIARMLLKDGAAVDAIDLHGITPLLLLTATPHHNDEALRMATLLIESGASVDAHDDQGRTSLYYARQHRLADIEKLLRTHGANE